MKIINREVYKGITNHEAGHYVVAKLLGFKTNDIRIKIISFTQHDAGTAIQLDEPIKNMQDMLNYCERRVKVLYAGAIAQSMDDTEINNMNLQRIFKQEAKSDCDKLREIVHIIRNIQYPDTNNDNQIQKQLDNIDKRLFEETVNLIVKNKELILRISNKLLNQLNEIGKEYILPHEKLSLIKGVLKI